MKKETEKEDKKKRVINHEPTAEEIEQMMNDYKKKSDLTGKKCYMSGCNGMLPAMFDVQPVARKNKIHQSELPVVLCEKILDYVTYEVEIKTVLG